MLIPWLLVASLAGASPIAIGSRPKAAPNDAAAAPLTPAHEILPRAPYLLEDPNEPINPGPTDSGVHTVAKFHPMDDRSAATDCWGQCGTN